MIKSDQLAYIGEYAYIPEHIIPYVTAISQAEPFLIGDYLAYFKKDLLIFIGYPLKEAYEEKEMEKELNEARRRFKPKEISLAAPKIPFSIGVPPRSPSDDYYRLDLSSLSISQKLRNMLTRAGRELSVKKGRDFGKEHRKLIKAFLKTHPVDEATRFIFERIGDYLAPSPTAWVFDARNNKGELVAFDIAEFNPKNYAIYMFNFSSETFYVPGASDLLLSEVIKTAKEENKKFVNLGLGINTGVTFFKKKWGGVPFCPYAFCHSSPSKRDIEDSFLNKL